MDIVMPAVIPDPGISDTGNRMIGSVGIRGNADII